MSFEVLIYTYLRVSEVVNLMDELTDQPPRNAENPLTGRACGGSVRKLPYVSRLLNQDVLRVILSSVMNGDY